MAHWKNPYAERDGQIHSNKNVPETTVEGNIFWRLDSGDTAFWIAESAGEFFWRNDHKERLATLDSANLTTGWNYRTEVDSEWTPLVPGKSWKLERTMTRYFRPDSAGVGFLMFKTVVIPMETNFGKDSNVVPNFGFKIQESA